MKVKSLGFDPSSDGYAVLLSDLEEERTLPIWIGPLEANAIALQVKNVHLHRPMTHDLIRNILKVFRAKVVKVEVMDLREDTYYALIHVRVNGKEITIDSRPSDAIAVAIGAGAPIYVAEEVLSKAKTIELDRMEAWLESLDREDFEYTA
jgi:hypothetical protein